MLTDIIAYIIMALACFAGGWSTCRLVGKGERDSYMFVNKVLIEKMKEKDKNFNEEMLLKWCLEKGKEKYKHKL